MLTTSRDSAVGTVTGCGLGNRGGRSFILGRVKNFLFSMSTMPIQRVLGALSPGVKRPGREVDHSPPASAEIKKMWIYTSTPPCALMAYCLISYAQGQLYLFHLYNVKFELFEIVTLKVPR
jgi:hypothetical protein